MHRQIIVSHNLVTEIEKMPAHMKRGSQITFRGDMYSITAFCAGSVEMTNEPVLDVHLNSIPVLQLA
jgi:hypothetical protein